MDIAGIDTDTIVSQLMALEQQPLTALQSRKTAAQKTSVAFGTLKSEVEAVKTAAAKLSTTSAYQRFLASVSNTSAGSAVISDSAAAAAAGSLTFTVTKVAGTHGLRSTGALTSGTDTIAAAGTYLAVGTTAGNVGISALSTGTGGTATLTGTAAVAQPTVITSGNNAFTALVDGHFTQISIAEGTYTTPDELASAVQDAVTAANLAITVTAQPGGQISFSADAAVSFGIGGGTAATALGISAGTTATGGDRVLDTGGFQTVFNGTPTTGSNTVAAAAGTTTVRIASTGDGSLAQVEAAIGAANGAVTAAAVDTGNGWVLQLGSKISGSAGQISIGAGVFTGAVGAFTATGSATDAEITVGAGTAGEYKITGDGNTFDGLLAGVTFTAKAVSSDPVTLGVSRNDAAITSDVKSLVDAINKVISDIKVQTYWNSETKTGGPLLGESVVRHLSGDLTTALNDVVGNFATGLLPVNIGIDLQRDGTFKFDADKFAAALADDPQKVADLLVGTGTTPGIAARVESLTSAVNTSGSGQLATAAEAAQDKITRFTEQIDDLQERLDGRQERMYQYWASVQTLLASMQNQGTWLSGQLSGLSNNWGG